MIYLQSINHPHKNTQVKLYMKQTFYFLKMSIVFVLFVNGCSTSRFIASKNSQLLTFDELTEGATFSQSIFFIGDAGEPSLDNQEPVLSALEKQLSMQPEKNVVVFLGDNIYPDGMPDPNSSNRQTAERKLDEQIKIIERSGARGIFIPGNHDWDKASADGWDRVKYQQKYIEAKNNSRIQFLPKLGCPGPDVIDVGGSIRLIILDTQWWLHDGPKPVDASSSCTCYTKEKILSELAVALRTAGGRKVFVASHHGFATHGPHGGFFDWKIHIFPLRDLVNWMWLPLPAIGSLYPLARNLGVTNQDLSSSAYTEMKNRIDSVFNIYPPLAHAAGHEHVLQVLKGSDKYFHLVSGCGTSVHDSPLTVSEKTLFADREPGFMRIDIDQNGRAYLRVFEPDENGNGKEVFWMELKK